MRAALAAAGAGAIGDYDSASFTTPGEGRFRPLAGANPTIGEVGRLEVVDEVRIEVVLPRGRGVRPSWRALLAAHPYEEPAYDVVELADPRRRPAPAPAGSATSRRPRWATSPRRWPSALPATAARRPGRPATRTRRYAGSRCAAARATSCSTRCSRTDADVYVTSDLRHHPASEFLEHDGPALVDVAHWAAEWTWLPVVEARLRAALGDTVETRVSTDPHRPVDLRRLTGAAH